MAKILRAFGPVGESPELVSCPGAAGCASSSLVKAKIIKIGTVEVLEGTVVKRNWVIDKDGHLIDPGLEGPFGWTREELEAIVASGVIPE